MEPPKPRLVVAQDMTAPVLERIARSFDAPPPPAAPLARDAVLALALAHEPAALLITGWTRADAAFIAALPRSVGILATASVGVDHIDLAAARGAGLAVTNTPDVLTDCNADHTFLLILAASRRATEYAALMREGWGRTMRVTELLGRRVSGRTLAILGMGRIGRAVARRARGFGMTVLYCNRRRLPPELEDGATFVADLDAMLPRAEILSLHLPGGPENEGIIDRRRLALLPPGAIFVNAARGTLVDEDALIEALRAGRLGGAGLDVYRNEPHIDRRFLDLPTVFMTPHVGSATHETRTAMGMRALDNIDAFLHGATPTDRLA